LCWQNNIGQKKSDLLANLAGRNTTSQYFIIWMHTSLIHNILQSAYAIIRSVKYSCKIDWHKCSSHTVHVVDHIYQQFYDTNFWQGNLISQFFYNSENSEIKVVRNWVRISRYFIWMIKWDFFVLVWYKGCKGLVVWSTTFTWTTLDARGNTWPAEWLSGVFVFF
jgi:hypothetical protein